MIDDPVAVNSLLEHYMFLVTPIFDALTPNYNQGLTKMKHHEINFMSKHKNIKIPELGKLISQKLIPSPNSYESCLKLVRKYEDNDLYKIINAFEQSVQQQQEYGMLQNKTELDIILDNVWNETKRMVNQKNAIEIGIETTIGIVGTLLTLPIGAFGGLLAGLGFKMADKYLGIKGSSLSESIVRKIRPNGLVNIYDFKKKYALN